jgi:hypothetical protein
MMTPEVRARQILEHNACEELDFLVDPIATAIREAQQEAACGCREALKLAESKLQYLHDGLLAAGDSHYYIDNSAELAAVRAALERCGGPSKRSV